MIQLVDHLIIAFLLLILPVYDAVDYRKYVAGVRAGGTLKTVGLFQETIVRDCLALTVFLVFWYAVDRPIAELGFTIPGGVGFWVSLLVVLVALVAIFYSSKSLDNATEKELDQARDKLGSLQFFLPRKSAHLKYFYALSFIAGVSEEIIYRGFVIWYLSAFVPIWAALIGSAVIFGLAHSYQGVSGFFRTGCAGLLMAALYILSGSIWLPIIAHIFGDALQGPMFVKILKGDRDELDVLRQ